MDVPGNRLEKPLRQTACSSEWLVLNPIISGWVNRSLTALDLDACSICPLSSCDGDPLQDHTFTILEI